MSSISPRHPDGDARFMAARELEESNNLNKAYQHYIELSVYGPTHVVNMEV